MTAQGSRPAMSQVDGFILAGGKSSRFGSDKALAIWKGRPLLVNAIGALKAIGLTPRIVTRDPLPYFELASAFVISERPEFGPLEGLRVALKSSSHEFALVLTADMPLVNKTHLQKLLASHAANTGVVFVSEDKTRHPFPGLYPVSALPTIESLPLGSSVQALLDRVPAHLLSADSDTHRALQGVNTPADLQSIE
jgi:molybdopterin-guanine dinucleotide biosynthesis protein A